MKNADGEKVWGARPIEFSPIFLDVKSWKEVAVAHRNRVPFETNKKEGPDWDSNPILSRESYTTSAAFA